MAQQPERRFGASDARAQGPPSALPTPTITFAAPGCVMGYSGKVAMVTWATQATPALVAELTQLLLQMCQTHNKFSSVHLATGGFRLPAADARASLDALTKRFGSQAACTALLVEGTGFWVSGVRSIVTGIAGVASPFKIKCFATICDLADWLAPRHSAETGETVSIADLEHLMAAMLEQPSVR